MTITMHISTKQGSNMHKESIQRVKIEYTDLCQCFIPFKHILQATISDLQALHKTQTMEMSLGPIRQLQESIICDLITQRVINLYVSP